MSEFFAEADVRISPDLRGFVQDLKVDLTAAIDRVEATPAAKVRISPALTRDFVGNLRKQVNIAVAQAARGVKPIQIRAVLSDASRAAIARELSGARVARAPIPVAAAPAAAPGVAGAVTAATNANTAFAASQSLVNTLVGRGAVDLAEHMAAVEADAAATKQANVARLAGANAATQAGIALGEETAATSLLANAKRELAVAQLLGLQTSAGAAKLRQANILAAEAEAAAIASNDQAGRKLAQSFRLQIRGLEGASAALNEHSRAAQRAASNMSQLRRGVLSTSLSFLGIRGATLAASARFLVAAAAVAVFAKAITSASETATQLNVFRATTQATGDDMERVSALSRELGADLSLPGVTALDAAQSMTELAKAGLSTQDAMDGARGVLQLATAAAIDNAQAVELAANAINAFQLAGREATHVADVFANAANAAQGSIVDIGIAFQQASAAGRQVGLSFEDTTTFLTILARNGLRGSDAGTSLRTALIRLIKPTKDAAKELERLGIETRDAAGNLRPDIFIQISEALRGVSPAVRDSTIALIGGQDAFRAITILGRQSIGEFIRLRRELREQGTAAELAEARMTGLRGALEGLGNTLSSIGLRAGTALTPALQGTVEGLSAATAGFADSGEAAALFNSVVESVNLQLTVLGDVLQGIGAVVLPVASGLAAITTAIGVPTIVAGLLAYAALGKTMAILSRVMSSTAVATLAVSAAMRPATFATAAFSAVASSAVARMNLYTIAIVAASAALFFLITRESAAERATRKFTAATDALVTAQERFAQAQTQNRSAGLGVNAAELGVLNAQQAAASAQAQLNASKAAEGTFARRKAEFELAVALDDVTIAQDALSAAIERANAANDEAAQASVNLQSAMAEEVATLTTLSDLRRNLPLISGEGGVGSEKQVAAAVRGTTDELLKRAQAERKEGSASAIALARRIELLALLAQAVQRVPTEREIDIAINTPNLKGALSQLNFEFDSTTQQLKDSLFKTLTSLGTSPEATAAILDLAKSLGIKLVPALEHEGHFGGTRLVHGVATGIDDATPTALSAIDRLLSATKGRLSGLERQALDLSIAGASDSAILANLQQQRREQERRVRTQEARLSRGEVAEETVRREKEELDRIIGEIRTLQGQMAADSKTAADEAVKKQDEIFENILRMMGVRRDARQQAIEDAGLTEGSGDDLSANRALRRLVNVQIAKLQDRIAAARKQGQAVQTLIAGLRILEGIYRELGRTVISLQKTRQEEIQARIAESNQLDIEFAQTTGNQQAEVRARLREIARLKKLQGLAKNDVLERKRLRNLIAEQEKAIRDLSAELGKVNNANAEMQFKFLQTQTGFAANLLGNLIPGGVGLGGLVGGTTAGGGGGGGSGADLFSSDIRDRAELNLGIGNRGVLPPGVGGARGAGGGVGGAAAGAAAKAAAAVAAGQTDGPTRGQQSVEIQLLRQILRVLNQIRRGNSHPEAHHVRKTSSGGGGGGADML